MRRSPMKLRSYSIQRISHWGQQLSPGRPPVDRYLYAHLFANLLNELRLGLNNSVTYLTPVTANGANYAVSIFGFKNTDSDPLTFGIPDFGISGISGVAHFPRQLAPSNLIIKLCIRPFTDCHAVLKSRNMPGLVVLLHLNTDLPHFRCRVKLRLKHPKAALALSEARNVPAHKFAALSLLAG